MKTKIRQKVATLTILLLIFIIPISLSFFNLKLGFSTISNGANTDLNSNIGDPKDFEEVEPKSSDIYHIGNEYNLLTWWNKSYQYRIGFILAETEGINRYQPIDIYFTFQPNEHYQNTERLVSFNDTGNDEWSDPIPMQMWNTTETGNYIDSCTITFIANVSANSNRTYFLYYNENDNGIEEINYNTNLSSSYSAGTLTVTVGNKYQAVLKTGLAATQLIRQGLDFHLDNSLAPEKELADPSLKFLSHFENSYSDATGNEADGIPTGGPSFTDGILRQGVVFNGSNFISYASGLEDTTDPFRDGSTEFTFTAWIKPIELTDTESSHGTRNCFAAKAGDSPNNDNFEIGINTNKNNYGTIHVYIDCVGADDSADFGKKNEIVVGAWNFIALRFNADTDVCAVRINDNWYSSNTWNTAVDLDDASGTPFTIGATEDINTYFNGVIDEVAVYNKCLSDTEVEEYKLGWMASTIQSITPIDELENGAVFSRYKVDWTAAFDMHAQDICTFYYDYNLWNIKRSIYFENEFDYSKNRMFALNTNFDLSVVDTHSQLLYIYDGNLQKDITTAGFVAENYTIIHNAPDPSKDAIGIFIEDFEVSDPAHTTISYFKGNVTYESGIVQFTPGSINDFDNSVGNESYKLNIDFWELAGSVNSSGSLNNADMINYFNNMLLTVREDSDVYIYNQESSYYTLDVNVTDIDNNLVPDATVTVWNASNYGISWSQDTDLNGRTIFTRFEEGTYDVNVSYVRYGKILPITTPQKIVINDTTAPSRIYYLDFTKVQMTSLALTLNRFNDTAQNNYKGKLSGAKVTFWLDDGSGPERIGSENANDDGELTFRWTNFSTPQDGNITFSVEWYEILASPVVAIGDLDLSNVVNTTFYFHVANSSIVNCTFGSSFETHIEFTIYPDPVYNQMLGETLYFQINLTYVENEVNYTAMDFATVNCNIFLGVEQINTQAIPFDPLGGGLYNLSIETANPVEPGGEEWLSQNDYIIDIIATKAGFETKQISTSFILDSKSSALIGNETELSAYWGETLTMVVTYTDISFGANNTIDDATVEYSVIGVPSLVGSLIPSGSSGTYLFELISSEFPNSDSYSLQITASKQNYREQSIFIDINVLAIKTLINGSVGLYKPFSVPFREQRIYYFNYTEESSEYGLAGSELRTYEWTKEVSGSIIDSGVGFLEDLGNGLYSLDFDTENREIASYTIMFNVAKENYAQRGGILILNVIPRQVDVNIPTGYIIQTTSGNDLTISLDLSDTINNSAIVGADVSITLQGHTFDFTDEGDGTYSIVISGSSLPEAFFLSETIPATITIDNEFYYSQEIRLSITVGLVEIFPGFPMFWFLMIIGAAVAVVGSLVVYRIIQKARIPTFVKRTREMSKDIKGEKSISDSLLYPSKEEFIVKKLGDKWDMLGLSLDEILGIKRKKGKKMPEISESEGGNF